MAPVDVPSRADLEAEFRTRLPAIADELIATLEPAVRLRPTPDGEPSPGRSRFGGYPDLPAEWEWPHWNHPTLGRRPLWFFAQIDLVDVSAAAPAPLGLPTDGLLSFFADFDDQLEGVVGLYSWEQSGSTILHTPSETAVTPVEGPSHGSGVRLEPVPAWTWRDDGIDLSNEEYEVLDDIDNRYAQVLRGIEVEGFAHGGRHQLGGHETFIQHPAAEEVVQALAGCYEGDGPGHFDHARWQAAESQVSDWQLVLQIDSDDALGVMWGDVGTLFWMARRSDVAADRWDECMFNFQSC